MKPVVAVVRTKPETVLDDVGRILRLDAVSTLHDADITRLGQWWQRARRCGHGYANLFVLHGAPPERYFERPLKSALVWGAAWPTGLARIA